MLIYYWIVCRKCLTLDLLKKVIFCLFTPFSRKPHQHFFLPLWVVRNMKMRKSAEKGLWAYLQTMFSISPSMNGSIQTTVCSMYRLLELIKAKAVHGFFLVFIGQISILLLQYCMKWNEIYLHNSDWNVYTIKKCVG